jgi:hypothetical protein
MIDSMVSSTELMKQALACERHPLLHEDVGQLVGESLAVVGSLEVVGRIAPLANPADHAGDQLLDATLALRRAQVAAKVFRDDDARGELGPALRNLDALLFEDDIALLVTDAGVAQLPFHRIEGVLTRPREVAFDGEPARLAASGFSIADRLEVFLRDLRRAEVRTARTIDAVVHLFSFSCARDD